MLASRTRVNQLQITGKQVSLEFREKGESSMPSISAVVLKNSIFIHTKQPEASKLKLRLQQHLFRELYPDPAV